MSFGDQDAHRVLQVRQRADGFWMVVNAATGRSPWPYEVGSHAKAAAIHMAVEAVDQNDGWRLDYFSESTT